MDDASHKDYPVPDMKSTSETAVKLLKSASTRAVPKLPADVVRSSPVAEALTRPKPDTPGLLAAVDQGMECVLRFATLDEGNSGERSRCFDNLTSSLARATEPQLDLIADKYLAGAEPGPALDLMVDAFGHLPTGRAQAQLTRHVLRASEPDEELVKRTLIVISRGLRTSPEAPSPALVRAIEDMAFHQETLPPALRTKVIRQRGLLMVGVLVRELSRFRSDEAHRLVQRLEDELGHHQDHATLQLRQRREAAEHDLSQLHPSHPRFDELAYQLRAPHREEEHKLVLLESLGNAALPRSLTHIISHVNSSVATPTMRRAGVSALRHFDCERSAGALIEAVTMDRWYHVRQDAYIHYRRHPLAMSVETLNSTVALAEQYHRRTPYMMTTVGNPIRQRRKSFNDFLKSLSFNLEVPKVDWDKSLGTNKLGAGFGVYLENRLTLDIDDLAGSFEVVVDDRVWAVAKLGIIGVNIDIFRAEACYKGGIGYDMNILKDFGIDNIVEVITKFDVLVENVIGKVKTGIKTFVDKIEDVVNNVKGAFANAKDGGLKHMFDELVDNIKTLPERMGGAGGIIKRLLEKLGKYDGIPVIAASKRVVRRVRNFVDAVRGDVMGLYNAVVDSITVDLPWAADNIWKSIQTLWKAFKSLFKSPGKSITDITTSIFRVQGAIKTILECKRRVWDALFFRNGVPWWMNLGQEFRLLLLDLKDVWGGFKGLFESAKLQEERALARGCGAVLSVARQKRLMFEDLRDTVFELIGPMESFQNLMGPFFKAWDSVMTLVKSIKEGFVWLKTNYEKASALIMGLFGPKFDPAFPKKIRACADGCDCGVFPSTAASTYTLPGIDVEVKEGALVGSPFEGTVYVTGPAQITVEPASFFLKNKKVVIDGVKPYGNYSGVGVFAPAGVILGTAVKSKCSPNFIHVAVVKDEYADDSLQDPTVGAVAEQNLTKLALAKDKAVNALHDITAGIFKKGDGIMDPTQFTKKKGFPFPKWEQVCDDYKLVFLDVTIAAGSISEAAKKAATAVARKVRGEDDAPAGEDDPPAGEPSTMGKFLREKGEKLKDEVMKAEGTLENDSSDIWASIPGASFAPLGSDVPQAQKFSIRGEGGSLDGPMSGFCVACMNVSSAFSLLKAADLDDTCLTGLKGSLTQALNRPGCVHPEDITDYLLRTRLRARGRSTVGSHDELVQRYIKVEPGQCPRKTGVTLSTLAACTVNTDCLGVSCCVRMREGFVQTTASFMVRADPCRENLIVSVDGHVETLHVNESGTAEFMATSASGRDCGTEVFVTATWRRDDQDNDLSVDLEAKLCNPSTLQCVGKTVILFQHSFSLDPGLARLDCGSLPDGLTIDARIDSMKLSDFDIQLRENDIDSRCLTKLSVDLRVAMVEQFASLVSAGLNPPEGQFPGEVFDICIPGVIQFPTMSVTFFTFSQLFMAGPVPLQFSIGAGGSLGASLELKFCLLSMKAIAVLTPWLGVDVYGILEVYLGVFFAGIRIDGRLMQTKFPCTATVAFTKFPLDVGLKMDLEMVPLAFKLSAFCQVGIKIFGKKITKTIFKAVLWEWSMAPIVKNIFDLHTPEKDDSAPAFEAPATDPSRAPVGTPSATCEVSQIAGRDHTDPAFKLEVFVSDDKSNITTTYSIGRSVNGDDVESDVEMGGMAIIEATTSLPDGIPLFFTVKAKNTDGGSSSVKCKLDNYDVTLPSGRFLADYEMSSNPATIAGALVVTDQTALVVDSVPEGLGVGRGRYAGDGIVALVDSSLAQLEHDREESLGKMGDFTRGRLGKLMAPVLKETTRETDAQCAEDCLALGNCLSFDHDGLSDKCILHSVIHGHDGDLHVDHESAWHHYERIGQGHGAEFRHSGLDMEHDAVYYFNAHVSNTLQYQRIFSSAGTLIDLTVPETGVLVNVTSNETTAKGCNVAQSQRCVEPTALPNHRVIVDGENSQTVFNGNQPAVDIRWTRDSVFAAANWMGFHDKETGLHNFEWRMGTEVCADDTWSTRDPHSHLHAQEDWDYMGTAFPLGGPKGLPQGWYYFRAGALNNVVHGGAMMTSVCHGAPYIIDKTPPTFKEVFDYAYADGVVSCRVDGYDNQSDIREVDLGLGNTRYDTEILDLTPYHWNEEGFVSHPIVVPDGTEMWAILMLTNNVDYETMGTSKGPLLIDSTPPICGEVGDGARWFNDIRYQKSASEICANWDGFSDPHSGLESYTVSFGDRPNTSNVVAPEVLSPSTHDHCVAGLTLRHNTTYYATVSAMNHGHLHLTCGLATDGVLVDLTDPEVGKAWAKDGDDAPADMAYSSSASQVSGFWDGFADPESGIVSYAVSVTGDGGRLLQSKTDVGDVKHFDNHHFHLLHGEVVRSHVTATDGALRESSVVNTTSFIVDLTPPELKRLTIGDKNDEDRVFQTSSAPLQANWQYEDPESGVAKQHLVVGQRLGGITKYVPSATPVDVAKDAITHTAAGLTLVGGGQYWFEVSAENGAGSITRSTSVRVTIDDTPPVITHLELGNVDGEETLVNPVDNTFDTSQNEGIEAWWSAVDAESGIASYHVAVGTTSGGEEVLGKTAYGLRTNGFVTGFPPLTVGATYFLTVFATNRAGTEVQKTSIPVRIFDKDRAGSVVDGPVLTADIDYQADTHTVTARFEGYFSLHGVVLYEWAVGVAPGDTSVQSFTGMGIHVDDDGVGSAQMPLSLRAGREYFVTVRALTGARAVLDSTSSGVLVDGSAPSLAIAGMGANAEGFASSPPTGVVWSAVDDESPVVDMAWWAGTSPGASNLQGRTATKETVVPAVPLDGDFCEADANACLGLPVFLTVWSMNAAGLESTLTSEGVTVDTTAAELGTLECPAFISRHTTAIECHWSNQVEAESDIASLAQQVEQGADEGTLSAASAPEPLPVGTSHSLHLAVNATTDSVFRARLSARNKVGLDSAVTSNLIRIDESPPAPGRAWIVGDGFADAPSTHASCQRRATSVHVAWESFFDGESGVAGYSVAVGTTRGGTQVRPYAAVGDVTSVHVHGLALVPGEAVFVSVRATNAAGVSTTVTTEGTMVFDSRSAAQTIAVFDGLVVGKQLQFVPTSESDRLSAHWRVGYPCAAARVEVGVFDADNKAVVDFFEVTEPTPLGAGVQGVTVRDLVAGTLSTEHQYHFAVRATDVFGASLVGRSAGAMVLDDGSLPLPGLVYDGPVVGQDASYQASTAHVDVSWTAFGNGTGSAHQQIAYYEVAVGTSVFSAQGRANVGPYRRVEAADPGALSFSYRYDGLSLDAESTTYFVTVKAHSVSGVTLFESSSGVVAGWTEVPRPGTVILFPFQSSTTSMIVAWSDFESSIDLTYRWAIGKGERLEEVSGECDDSGKPSALTSVRAFTDVEDSTAAAASGLSLVTGGAYFVTVQARDGAGNCVQVSSVSTVADATAPVAGRLLVHGKVAAGAGSEAAVYVPDPQTLEIAFPGFSDAESGIESYLVSITSVPSCSADDESAEVAVLLEPSTLPWRVTAANLTQMQLQPDVPYTVHLTAVNGAGEHTQLASGPVLLDSPALGAGHLNDGHVLNEDVVFQDSQDTMSGIFTQVFSPDQLACPDIEYPLTGGKDDSWTAQGTVQRTTGVLLKEDNADGSVVFEDAFTTITSARDLNAAEFNSGLYTAPAPTAYLGGTTTVLLRAADHVHAASTFAFWDGEVNASLLAGLHQQLSLSPPAQDQYARVEPGFVYNIKNNSAWDPPIGNATGADAEEPVTQMPPSLVQANADDVAVWRGEDHYGEVSRDAGEGFNAIGFHVLPAAEGNTDPNVNGRVVLWCRFADAGRPMKMEVSTMRHDPTDALHRYQLQLSMEETDKQGDWNVELRIDGETVAVMFGAPPLSRGTHMAAHAWDINAARGDIPPLDDVFAAPVGIMELRSVAVPSEPEEQVCGPGASFYSFGSPIVAFKAAVGRRAGADDQHAFATVKTPCIPCVRPCDRYICDPECSADQAEHVISVAGLTLEGYSDARGDWESTSGAEVNASTVGPGDAAIIGVDAANGVVFVATLVDFAAGTSLMLTADAWNGTGFAGRSAPHRAVDEGAEVPAGTLFRVEGVDVGGGGGGGEGEGVGPFVLALYAGDEASPTFVYAAEHKANATLVPAYGLRGDRAVAHLPAPHAAYTRGPSIAPHADMLAALRTASNWQAAAESFEPFDWLPGSLGVVESPVDEGHDSYEHPGVFFLTVVGVTASGRELAATSSGVLVDTTPPVLVEAFMFRLEDGERRPIRAQRSMDSIAMWWLFTDPESEITSYGWTIGTTPGGDDILPEKNVGLSLVGRKTGLTLEEGQHYYATVYAYNGAGLRASFTPENGTFIDLSAPDLSSMETLPNEGNVTENLIPNLPEDIVLTTTRDDIISIRWSGVKGEIEAMDWTLGTEGGLEDILPPTWVGPGPKFGGAIGFAEVRDGQLFIGEVDQSDQINVGTMLDLAQLNNPDPVDPKLYKQNLRLEPGVCVHHRIRAHTAAGVISSAFAAVCIMPDGSAIVTPVDEALILSVDAEGVNVGGRRRRSAGDADDTLEVVLDASPAPKDAAMKVGVLSDDELTRAYAGASAAYLPYISNPYTTLHLVTRSLLQRNAKYLGLSLFAGLLEQVTMDKPVTMTVHFDKTRDWSRQMPSVLFWDVSASVWRQVYDTCGVAPVVDYGAGTLVLQLCSTNRTKDRLFEVDAGTPAMFSLTTQFIVASIDKQFVSTAPRVTVPTMSVREGSTLTQALAYTDGEGDVADVALSGGVSRGQASVAGGVLTYVPDCVLCGPHQVAVQLVATERLQHEGRPLASQVTTVTINVAPINRPPSLLLANDDGSLSRAPASLELMTVVNRGQPLKLPTVFAADAGGVTLTASAPDGSLAWSSSGRLSALASSLGGALDPAMIGYPASSTVPFRYAALEGTFSPSLDKTGDVEVRFIARDDQGAFGDVFVAVVTLTAPCDNDGVFRDGTCRCTPRWRGDTCQELNPCFGVTCPGPSLCHDAEQCNDATGNCEAQPQADGHPCTSEASGAHHCQAGACVLAPTTTTSATAKPTDDESGADELSASSGLAGWVYGVIGAVVLLLIVLCVVLFIVKKR